MVAHELDPTVEEVSTFIDPSGDGSVTALDALVVINSLSAAAAAVDVPIFTGTVAFGPGETEKVITVNVSGDTDVEENEDFAVTLSNPSGSAQITNDYAESTILNDDTDFQISPLQNDKLEGDVGDTEFTFTVTRSGDVSNPGSIEYAVTGSGLDPADAADFGGTLPGGIIEFDANQSSTTLTIRVSGDTDFESDNGFTVTLSEPGGNAEISVLTANGMIRNDDAAPPVETPEVEEVVYYNQDADAEKDFSLDSTGQRSIIRRIRVTFSGPVTVPLGAVSNDSFVVESTSGATLGEQVGLEVLSSELVGGKQVVVLGFTGDNLIDDKSVNVPGVRPMLEDGNYQLSVNGTVLGIDANGDAPGTSHVDDFFRFFGDSDGDRDVDGLDYFAFRRYFRDGILDNRFDCDQDTVVSDPDDAGEFSQRYGRVLR